MDASSLNVARAGDGLAQENFKTSGDREDLSKHARLRFHNLMVSEGGFIAKEPV
jgi:hypothetical protein